MIARRQIVPKVLQAVGIAATMIALVQGIYGDMWGELYLFVGGIVVFYGGRVLEKRVLKRMDGTDRTTKHERLDLEGKV